MRCQSRKMPMINQIKTKPATANKTFDSESKLALALSKLALIRSAKKRILSTKRLVSLVMVLIRLL